MPWVSGAVGSSGCLMEGWALGAGDVGSDVGCINTSASCYLLAHMYMYIHSMYMETLLRTQQPRY